MGKRRRQLRKVASLLVILLVVEYLVLPQLAGARKSLHLLARVNLAYVVLAVVLEQAAVVAYVQLTRAVLPCERAVVPSLFTLLRIQETTLAVSHVVPGGTAAGTSLGYRLLTAAGVDPADAAFALATQGLGSAVVLNLLLWLGLLVSIPLRGFNPLYLTAAGLGVIVIGGFIGLVTLLTRGEERAARLMRGVAKRIPFVDPQKVEELVLRLADRLQTLFADRRLVARATGWAAANWLLDAASLWVFLAAFGARVGVDGLIVAFGLANVLAAIPITPGGLGVIETVLTSSLVGFGTPRGVAILGVISYRLVNFWLPIPLGGLAYASLEFGAPATSRKERAEELRELAEESMQQADDPRQWAERFGVRLPPGKRDDPPR
jgi:uncharacterized protein (TIRG00374 family)